ncbi:hypothetical protein ACIRA0001_1616 [Acinetobacter radioresistens SK82]|uniref:ASCH domain-containing protein n=1 Tax=Acinetobacter radioresistens SK82 TaxID=596318 RepID=A0ABM9YP97_ACIRA|nr:hypothetical protein [Acinetobacter radioresistens]EET82822.1 hypothetical protein ACIRA0001_1616 [Acinetobacter radioresistens SK82]QMU05621.1 hypothetical protein FOC39_01575 [Acinetobacter radioresistens]
MKIKTAFAEQFSTHDYDPDFAAHYFGRIELHLDTPLVVLGEEQTQRITLSILVLQDGTIDTDQVCTIKLYKGKPEDKAYLDEFLHVDELTTTQFDHFTNLEEVKREIGLFGMELAQVA